MKVQTHTLEPELRRIFKTYAGYQSWVMLSTYEQQTRKTIQDFMYRWRSINNPGQRFMEAALWFSSWGLRSKYIKAPVARYRVKTRARKKPHAVFRP